jgi:hypothetical protein
MYIIRMSSVFSHFTILLLCCYYCTIYYQCRSDVCTKYQEASKIVNLCLQGLIGQCVPGAKIVDLCQFGTAVMEAQANKLYTKKVGGKVVERGVAFPVCISVNDVVCNHSPLSSEELVRFLRALLSSSCTTTWLYSTYIYYIHTPCTDHTKWTMIAFFVRR